MGLVTVFYLENKLFLKLSIHTVPIFLTPTNSGFHPGQSLEAGLYQKQSFLNVPQPQHTQNPDFRSELFTGKSDLKKKGGGRGTSRGCPLLSE